MDLRATRRDTVGLEDSWFLQSTRDPVEATDSFLSIYNYRTRDRRPNELYVISIQIHIKGGGRVQGRKLTF